jgi:hypothetical protein
MNWERLRIVPSKLMMVFAGFGHHRWKATGEQYDERIVECCWDEGLQSWKFMRFRDDKHDGNFIEIGDKIIHSIKDGVVQKQVGARVGCTAHSLVNPSES